MITFILSRKIYSFDFLQIKQYKYDLRYWNFTLMIFILSQNFILINYFMTLKIVIFFYFIYLVTSAFNYTNCYGNCNLCASNNFAQCLSGSYSCMFGYMFNQSSQSCNIMPAYNVYTAQFTKTNFQESINSWVYKNSSNIIKTSQCTTSFPNQTIYVVGTFQNEIIQKTVSIDINQVLIINVYFIRLNWQNNDNVQFSILNGINSIYNQTIDINSFGSDQKKSSNYITYCTGYSNSINGKQFNVVLSNVTGPANITILFQPSLSLNANWAFSNFRVFTGCNNFILFLNGSCSICMNGYYYDTILNNCMRCDPSCLTCNGPSNTSCQSCPLYSNLSNSMCIYNGYFTAIQDYGKMNSTTSISICQNINLIGGYKYGFVNSIINLTYILTRHSYLKLTFSFLRFGDWSNVSSFIIKLDNVIINSIKNFTDPQISPFCFSQIGPSMASSTIISSVYFPHLNPKAIISFITNGTNSSNKTFYAIRDIVIMQFSCSPQCYNCTLGSYSCGLCNQFLTISSSCLVCPLGFYENIDTTITCKKCYILCKNCNGPYSTNCTECFSQFQLHNNYCSTNKTLSYALYSQELTQFNFDPSNFVSNNSNTLSCSTYVVYGNLTNPVTIKRTYRLPVHKGVLIMLNVIKFGVWTGNNSNITMYVDGVQQLSIPTQKDVGSELCTINGNDFIYTLTKQINGHTSNNLQITIVGGGGGIGIYNLVLVLKNCDYCNTNQLSFFIEYMPIYKRDNSIQALNSWIIFNKPIYNANRDLSTFFEFMLNNVQVNILQTQYRYDLRVLFSVKQPFVAKNLTVVTELPQAVFSTAQSSGLMRLLTQMKQTLTPLNNTIQIVRYDFLDEDDLLSINQIYNFFCGITNFVLYCSLICLGLGFGIVIQELFILLQLLYMHIYLISNQLPASFKLSLEGMQIIEHFNYFTIQDKTRIQNAILPLGLHQKSPHTFQQYNTDVNFIRAIYPIVILNLIFGTYFLILYLIYTYSESFQKTQNKILRIFKQAAQRPINFLDSFMRIQFVTVIWSCFCQFSNFDSSINSTFKGFNSFFCILFFICACAYPVVLLSYLRIVRLNRIKQSFNFMYEDIFYMKFKKNQDQFESYLYIFIRFFRYFIYVVFITQFLDHQIITPVVIIIMNLLEVIFILLKDIYMNNYLLAFKLIQSLFLSIYQIFYIIIFSFSNTSNYADFTNIGFILNAMIIILIINAFARFIYLSYIRILEFLNRKYRVDRSKPIIQSNRELKMQKPVRKVTYLPNISVTPSVQTRHNQNKVNTDQQD